jgi:histidine ammonia-lyase
MIELNGRLTIDDVIAVAREYERIELTPDAAQAIARSQEVTDHIVESEERRVYGINTGFGDLQDIAIPREHLSRLQENIVRSHAATVGEPAPTEVVRAAMLVRANTLSYGVSGVGVGLVEQFIAMLNAGVHPQVPLLGSSDDLGAAAHIGEVLIGEGTAEYDGEVLPGDEALSQAGIEPHIIEPKEGLAAISGTPIMTGILSLALHDIETVLQTADMIGALTFAAVGNASSAFDHRVQEVRSHGGHAVSAANVRALLGSDSIDDDDEMVQDPLSLRLIPQIHGTARHCASFAKETLEIELQSATDNPLVFPDGKVYSCGNFCGQPLASAADLLASNLGKIAVMSEQRADQLLTNETDTPFLADNPGLESGLMIAHYTSASLTAEEQLQGYASESSIVVSGGQEDVHSMGTIAARMLLETIERLQYVLAVELLCIIRWAQLHPGKDWGPSTTIIEQMLDMIDLPQEDVPLHNKIEETAILIGDGAFIDTVDNAGVDLR